MFLHFIRCFTPIPNPLFCSYNRKFRNNSHYFIGCESVQIRIHMCTVHYAVTFAIHFARVTSFSALTLKYIRVTHHGNTTTKKKKPIFNVSSFPVSRLVRMPYDQHASRPASVWAKKKIVEIVPVICYSLKQNFVECWTEIPYSLVFNKNTSSVAHSVLSHILFSGKPHQDQSSTTIQTAISAYTL